MDLFRNAYCGSGRDLIYVAIPAFACTDLRKSRDVSVRTDGFRTQDAPHASCQVPL
jgi:hypothetical protein